ncbi:MAG TPA: YiiX/YebB-like N1pC/P60 family cysteine hydrolase [Candidatus Hydrogenedentes bacterium]|nr:YiiX/YebB-like N1pC/P60 family cysteine hydrolase [Candidatus Hydrogenedentota bacterium]
MKYPALLAALVLCGCATTSSSPTQTFDLRPGDLLFQDLDAGPLCDAIETVTQGVDGAKFSHVGMVSHVQGRNIVVIEAVGAGVVETPLNDFLARSKDANGNPKVLVGRMESLNAENINRAIDISRGFLGRPYDKVFTMDNSAFYCSELLYEAFRDANDGEPVFGLFPMTFKDPATAATFPAWTSYYEELKVVIPEGMPGLNPGGMSRSTFVTIVHAFGAPDGWQNNSVASK